MNTYGRGPVPGEEKNGYVPLGTYQNINLENFGGGPVQYFKKFPYSNFLGRTSQKNHPVGPRFSPTICQLSDQDSRYRPE